MGGMQVLEWAIMYPQRVRSIIPIATCMQATAQQIAWGAIGRRAIELDPRWRGGDYYDAEPGDGPDEGLAVARMVAQVTFRSDNVFTERFGRDLVDDRFEVERYLDYHGAKLGRRFDTGSYVTIGTAMDLHDVARSRGSVAGAMGRIRASALTIGISSDLLYPNYQQRQIDELLRSEGIDSTLRRGRLPTRPRRLPDQPRPARRSDLTLPRLTACPRRGIASSSNVAVSALFDRDAQDQEVAHRIVGHLLQHVLLTAAGDLRRLAAHPVARPSWCASGRACRA